MTLFSALNQDEMSIVKQFLDPVSFLEGDCIMEQGSEGTGCYFIDAGTVRVEFDTGELDTDVVLNYLEPGAVMGDFALIDHRNRGPRHSMRIRPCKHSIFPGKILRRS